MAYQQVLEHMLPFDFESYLFVYLWYSYYMPQNGPYMRYICEASWYYVKN